MTAMLWATDRDRSLLIDRHGEDCLQVGLMRDGDVRSTRGASVLVDRAAQDLRQAVMG